MESNAQVKTGQGEEIDGWSEAVIVSESDLRA
jgi:hypothetical protein